MKSIFTSAARTFHSSFSITYYIIHIFVHLAFSSILNMPIEIEIGKVPVFHSSSTQPDSLLPILIRISFFISAWRANITRALPFYQIVDWKCGSLDRWQDLVDIVNCWICLIVWYWCYCLSQGRSRCNCIGIFNVVDCRLSITLVQKFLFRSYVIATRTRTRTRIAIIICSLGVFFMFGMAWAWRLNYTYHFQNRLFCYDCKWCYWWNAEEGTIL